MPDASAPAAIARIRARFAAAGRPWTRARAAVLRVLARARTPLTAEEIHARLGAAREAGRPAARAVDRSASPPPARPAAPPAPRHRSRRGRAATLGAGLIPAPRPRPTGDRPRVPARGRPIDLSSVYRTLHLLLALGAVRRVRLGDGAGRFELAEGEGGHHHHLVCEVCGRIEDVRHCPVEGRDLGARVRAHSLELYGLCGACGPARRRRATSARAASGAGPVVRAGRGGGRGTRAGAAG